MSTSTLDLAKRLGALLQSRGWRVATAESCTGGLVAGAITDIGGSSAWFERGYVTYSNEAKTAMLGVRLDTLAAHGAVSEATAWEMAAGALDKSGADLAVAITGIAGPSGGSPEKPVGLVHLGCASNGGETAHRRFVFAHSDRHEVRMKSVKAAFDLIESQIEVTTRLA